MNRRFSLIIAGVIAAGMLSPCQADDGWSLSKLNPFRKKSTASSRVRASLDDEMAEAQMRTQMPRSRKEPSTWSKMNQGTKDLLGKTKSVLMPWTNKKKSSAPRQAKSAKKSSFLTSWLPKKEAPKRSESVRDFLGRERPGF